MGPLYETEPRGSTHTSNKWRDTRPLAWRSGAPLRLSLAGGGSDLAGYSEAFGGAVINLTIGRYAYAHLRLTEGPSVVMEACDAEVEERSESGIAPSDSILPLHWGVYTRISSEYNDGLPFGA